MSDFHLRHVTNANWHAIFGGDNNILDLFQIDRSTDAVDQQHFAAVGNRPTTYILVVRFDGFANLLERQSILHQQIRLQSNLILFLVTTPTIDLRNAANRTQLGLHHPVVDRTQFRHPLDAFLLCDLGKINTVVNQHIVKDLAQPCRNRPHLRSLNPVGQLDGGKPFVDQLSGEVDVDAIVKDHNDLRQAEL